MSAAIAAAARAGGPDPSSNMRLAAALDRARAAGTPKAVMERAVASGSGAGGGGDEVTFEVFGPARVAILVEALTNNKARTTLGLRAVLKRHGGELQAGGALAFMFESRGRLEVPLVPPPASVASGGDALDALLEAATDAEALDVEPAPSQGDAASAAAIVWTDAPRMYAVAKALESAGWTVAARELTRRPTVTVGVPEADEDAVLALLRALEDHEDVQSVHHNIADGE